MFSPQTRLTTAPKHNDVRARLRRKMTSLEILDDSVNIPFSDLQCRNAKTVGAGILCCAQPPNCSTDSIYFLLCKGSFFAPRRRQGQPDEPGARGGGGNAHRWSIFGGRLKNGEDECDAAARELAEETCCSLPDLFGSPYSSEPIAADNHELTRKLAQELRDGDYLFKITHFKWRVAKRVLVKYVMFVRMVPWCPDANERFHHVYTAMKNADQHLPQLENSHPGVRVTRDLATNAVVNVEVMAEFMEKTQVRWWSKTRLREVLRCQGRYYSDQFCYLFLSSLRRVLEWFDERNE